MDDDWELEEEHNDDFFDNNSAEDTDEASECEVARNYDDTVEIKEQMYHDKLAFFQKQLEDLDNGVHVEFMRRVRKLEQQYNERLRLNEVYREYLVECVERDYIFEKRSAAKEFDEKKADLKDNLLTDFEDRRKLIETERQSMELTSDSTEIKPITRKLRRRPNEPLPVVEKRRKPTNGQLVLMLDDKDVENDLKSINRAAKGGPMAVRPMTSSLGGGCSMGSINGGGIASSSISLPMLSGGSSQYGSASSSSVVSNSALCMSPMGSGGEILSQTIETKIEDGKLLYERRWFHRGQPVFVEAKDERFPGIISAINDVVWVKKLTDNGSKIKINTSQLSRGKISIKRRAT